MTKLSKYAKAKPRLKRQDKAKSFCCRAPLLGGVQCEACGADGRKRRKGAC